MKNEIKVSFCFKDESGGLCPKLGGTADNTFVPVILMTGAIFCKKRGRRMSRAELPERIGTVADKNSVTVRHRIS